MEIISAQNYWYQGNCTYSVYWFLVFIMPILFLFADAWSARWNINVEIDGSLCLASISITQLAERNGLASIRFVPEFFRTSSRACSKTNKRFFLSHAGMPHMFCWGFWRCFDEEIKQPGRTEKWIFICLFLFSWAQVCWILKCIISFCNFSAVELSLLHYLK